MHDEQLQNSPSRRDGIDEATEITLRIYGCDLIQESGILLKLGLLQVVYGLLQSLNKVLGKQGKSSLFFTGWNVEGKNLPIEHLDTSSKKYVDLKADLIRTERHLLKEMGFVCHVEHPHKFISNYLATLGTPPELRQEAWNLANDR
ncbi:Cyclin-L1-1 [Forsythia ovata]|uniref:Cyclin-L1-1 n=1 Tax=Forsythia ovata TaxID=205694 RepID=A0ABD1USK1_9LAMI